LGHPRPQVLPLRQSLCQLFHTRRVTLSLLEKRSHLFNYPWLISSASSGENKKWFARPSPSEACRRFKRNKRSKNGGIRRAEEPKKRRLQKQIIILLVQAEEERRVVGREAKVGVESGEAEEEGITGRAGVVGGVKRRLRM
jgi:hypothetical protein